MALRQSLEEIQINIGFRNTSENKIISWLEEKFSTKTHNPEFFQEKVYNKADVYLHRIYKEYRIKSDTNFI